MIITPVVFSALTWILVSSLFFVRIRGGDNSDLFTLIGLAVLTFIFFLSTFAIAMMVDGHEGDHVAVIALATASVAFSGLSLITAMVMLLTALGLVLYRKGMLEEAKSRIHFSLQKTIRASLSVCLTLLLFAVSMQSLSTSRPLQGPQEFFDSTVNGTIRVVERVIPLFLREYQSGKTIDAFLGERLGTETMTDQNGQLAPVDIVAAAKQTSIAEARKQLGENLGLTLTGTETMTEVIQQAVRHRVDPSLSRYTNLIAVILMLSLFLLLKIFSPILWLFSVGLTTLLFHVYRHLKIVSVVPSTEKVDRLILT